MADNWNATLANLLTYNGLITLIVAIISTVSLFMNFIICAMIFSYTRKNQRMLNPRIRPAPNEETNSNSNVKLFVRPEQNRQPMNNNNNSSPSTNINNNASPSYMLIPVFEQGIRPAFPAQLNTSSLLQHYQTNPSNDYHERLFPKIDL